MIERIFRESYFRDILTGVKRMLDEKVSLLDHNDIQKVIKFIEDRGYSYTEEDPAFIAAYYKIFFADYVLTREELPRLLDELRTINDTPEKSPTQVARLGAILHAIERTAKV